MSQNISKLSEHFLSPIRLNLKHKKNRIKTENSSSNESLENNLKNSCIPRYSFTSQSIKPNLKNLTFVQRNQNKSKTLKSNTQEPNIKEAEKQLTEIMPSLNTKEKFDRTIEICKTLESSFTDFSKIFEIFKEILESLLSDHTTLAAKYEATLKEYQDCKHTEKILRKRFQKLAFENLQLNDEVVKKDETEEILKQKIKKYKNLNSLIKDGEKYEKVKKKNFFIKKEIENLNTKILNLTEDSNLYKKLVRLIKNHQNIPRTVKEEIIERVTEGREYDEEFTRVLKEDSFFITNESSIFTSFLIDP